MRQFTITVAKCGNCPYGTPEDDVDWGECSHDASDNCYGVYAQNKDGLTPSCPMWDKTAEVSE